jgi:copper resistance protein D
MPDLLLVAARALDFGALAQFAGLFVFLRLVIEPALFASRNAESSALRMRFLALAWASLVLILLSSVIWLWLEAQAFTGEPLSAVWRDGVVVTVLKETHFGRNWDVRAVLTALAVILLSLPRRDGARRQVALLALASGMLASVAWAGHGGATPGSSGDVHLVADVFHLLGVGCWVGGLLPLALTFAAAGRARDPIWTGWATSTTKRFSTLGLWAVGTVLVTGVVNSWFLVSGPASLVSTSYGRLLLAKIALFLIAIAIAGVNRIWLTPQLAHSDESAAAIRSLRLNSVIELTLASMIFLVVGALGLLPPALHTAAGMMT